MMRWMQTRFGQPSGRRLLSIVTATWAPSAQYLHTAWLSLREQTLPPGWDWEWLLQEDGASQMALQASAWAQHDGRVLYASNPGTARVGTAQTRNLALARAQGELVAVLDHDDMFVPGALASLVEAFVDESVGWACGRADDLRTQAGHLQREPYPALLEPGRVPLGKLMDVWEGTDVFPVHCAGIIARTPLVRALGGWAALPRSEDLSLVAALSEMSEGWYLDQVTFVYRKWGRQATKGADWIAAQQAAHASVRLRALAIRSMRRSATQGSLPMAQ